MVAGLVGDEGEVRPDEADVGLADGLEGALVDKSVGVGVHVVGTGGDWARKAVGDASWVDQLGV